MKKNRSILIGLISFFLLFFPFNVFAAGSATVGFSANNSVYLGNTITVTMYVSNVSGVPGGISSVGGYLKFDNSYLEYVSGTGVTSPYTFTIDTAANYKIAGLDLTMNNLINSSGQTKVFTFVFKAKKLGNTTISFSNYKLTDTNSDIVTTSISSKTISVVPAPSSNNYLASLTTNQGTVNFNKSTTSYKLEVGSTVTSITISATPEDSTASVSGTGAKQLNYGSNKISIVVTAANGDKRTYTIDVVRKDDRSSNNKLASLSVKEGSFSPSFNANTEKYSMSVPYSVSKLTITAKPQDDKATVSISGNTNLVAEASNKVTIKVTAENGSVRTYTIDVKRGKDPNKVLSQDNYLSSMVVDVGILSPSFDREKTNYVVYLPFEITNININVELSDKVYGVLKVNKPDSLVVGNNVFTYTVTAEDESIRVYTVTVIRGSSLDDTAESSAYLKDIKLKNGSLEGKFNKKVFVYYYNKKKNFSFEAIPENENNKIITNTVDDIITILVESTSGETNVYILLPKEINYLLIVVIIESILLAFSVVYIIYRIKIKK